MESPGRTTSKLQCPWIGVRDEVKNVWSSANFGLAPLSGEAGEWGEGLCVSLATSGFTRC